ncbi:hypothetical protein VCR31J2_1360104 [Vibrio coralliirubri]|uniref:Uncharacterized protein n=1 Tax=Vibrio coralliirubri TaxID=1516159 RepID=A0AA86X0M3_9VIBR|nr:hypothetical protein VCR31J2_1360104 [Vibrio coralliirubri]
MFQLWFNVRDKVNICNYVTVATPLARTKMSSSRARNERVGDLLSNTINEIP